MKKMVFAVILLALGAAAPARADEWTKQYTVSGKPDLRVRTDDGSVEIEVGEGGQVSARVTTSGWRISSSEVRVNESQSGNHIEIEVRVPRGNWGWFGSGRHSVQLLLRIPRETDLDVHTGDGHVNCGAASGKIRIETGDGHISANGLHGQIQLHTGDGRIEGSDLDGSLRAETGDGRIILRGRFEGLDVRTGDGHIEVTVERGSKMASEWSLRTGDGPITLSLPDGFSAELDAHTDDGHIRLDFPVTVSGSLSRNSVRGPLNGGGNVLRVETRDGSIAIRRE